MIACIPTKGRPATKTYKLFQRAGIEVMHFIEPQEMDLYDVPNKVSILKNNGGISYVRNFILDYSKQHTEWILMCDDDVTAFGIAKNGKTIKTNADIWHQIYGKVANLPWELIGISYAQFAWAEKHPYTINKNFAEVCVLMNVNRIKWRYREQFNLKEDRDFTLQTIKNGYGVIRFNRYWLNSPTSGVKLGGLHDEYNKKTDERAAKLMCMEWSPFVKMRFRWGRWDMKADIQELAKYYNKTIK